VRGEFAEFLIDHRKQFIGSFGVAMLDGVEHLRDIAHGFSLTEN